MPATTSEAKAKIFKDRAAAQRKQAAQDWAAAKNGEGNHYYGKARREYKSAEECERKARELAKGK